MSEGMSSGDVLPRTSEFTVIKEVIERNINQKVRQDSGKGNIIPKIPKPSLGRALEEKA